MAESLLEGVTPIQHYIDPVAAFARPTIRSRAAVDLVAESKIIARLAYPVIEVARVIPQDIDARAHTWRDDVPHIPLSQENSVAMELGDISADPRSRARNTRRAVTTNLDFGALKVCA